MGQLVHTNPKVFDVNHPHVALAGSVSLEDKLWEKKLNATNVQELVSCLHYLISSPRTILATTSFRSRFWRPRRSFHSSSLDRIKAC